MYDTMKVMYGIADNLERILDEKGMSQKELCRLANLDRTGVNHYIMGQTVPSIKSMLNMCNALGITVNEFLGV